VHGKPGGRKWRYFGDRRIFGVGPVGGMTGRSQGWSPGGHSSRPSRLPDSIGRCQASAVAQDDRQRQPRAMPSGRTVPRSGWGADTASRRPRPRRAYGHGSTPRAALRRRPPRNPSSMTRPPPGLVRQVLGAISEFDKAMTVAKLRGARERKRRDTGKCEGRKSHAERNPELVARRTHTCTRGWGGGTSPRGSGASYDLPHAYQAQLCQMAGALVAQSPAQCDEIARDYPCRHPRAAVLYHRCDQLPP
jgi:hypothetical protein